MENKPRVLISSPYYLPGYRAGGALRTVANLVAGLGTRIDFRIVTRDRDVFMHGPYEALTREYWLDLDNARVYYVDQSKLSFAYWRTLLNQQDYDVLYLNSLFSYWFSIKPAILARFGLLRNPHLLLAPRGELSVGALSLKSRKKQTFLTFAKHVKLYDRVVFQASSQEEQHDIVRVFGKQARVVIAGDVPAPLSSARRTKVGKAKGTAVFVFLGRITPVKNLKGALLVLSHCKKACHFMIYGPVGDVNYWEECVNIIARMPKQITVKYMGEVDNNSIDEVFDSAHFLLLPSLGENFGHVIYEALARGTPVLISNQTPWRDLQVKQVGWDLPLEDAKAWESALSTCITMESRQFQLMSEACAKYALLLAQDSYLLERSYELLASFSSAPKQP